MYLSKAIVLLCSATSLLAVSNFPAYLQKCKNDDHLNECFFKSAQAGIANILKGDPELGIPTYLPINLPDQFILGTNDLKLDLDNITSIVDLTVNETKWNTVEKNIGIKFNFQKITWDYTGKLEGTFLDLPVSAHGHFTHIYENGLASCDFPYDIVEVGGIKYANITGGTCEYKMRKVTYIFENMNDDMQQFINKNWEKFDGLMHKQVQELIFPLYALPFNAIFKVVPFDELFE